MLLVLVRVSWYTSNSGFI